MVYLPFCLLLKDNTRKFWKECYKCNKFSLRKVDVQQSSIIRITQIRCFYRFIVNLRFASAASFAPVTLSCIRYPAVPVCKKCAKMCRVKINHLKQVSDFYAKPGKRPGSSPKQQLRYHLFRLTHQMYINNYDSWQGA